MDKLIDFIIENYISIINLIVTPFLAVYLARRLDIWRDRRIAFNNLRFVQVDKKEKFYVENPSDFIVRNIRVKHKNKNTFLAPTIFIKTLRTHENSVSIDGNLEQYKIQKVRLIIPKFITTSQLCLLYNKYKTIYGFHVKLIKTTFWVNKRIKNINKRESDFFLELHGSKLFMLKAYSNDPEIIKDSNRYTNKFLLNSDFLRSFSYILKYFYKLNPPKYKMSNSSNNYSYIYEVKGCKEYSKIVLLWKYLHLIREFKKISSKYSSDFFTLSTDEEIVSITENISVENIENNKSYMEIAYINENNKHDFRMLENKIKFYRIQDSLIFVKDLQDLQSIFLNGYLSNKHRKYNVFILKNNKSFVHYYLGENYQSPIVVSGTMSQEQYDKFMLKIKQLNNPKKYSF